MSSNKARDGSYRYALQTSLSGGHSEWVPPDPFPNSEVKLLSADDSVGFPHVKVGHCQTLIPNPDNRKIIGVFYAMFLVRFSLMVISRLTLYCVSAKG